MERELQEVSHHNHGEPTVRSCGIAMDQFEAVHQHLHERLCAELSGLERRVRALRESPSMHSPTIISTYERMIRNKRDFMERWGMDDTCCGCL